MYKLKKIINKNYDIPQSYIISINVILKIINLLLWQYQFKNIYLIDSYGVI